jgi:hypothetical protein
MPFGRRDNAVKVVGEKNYSVSGNIVEEDNSSGDKS